MRVQIILTSIVTALSLTSGVAARRNTVSRSSNGVGCTADIATSSVGFNAKFYSYDQADLIPFNDNNFVANDYTTRGLYTTATGVVEPNFSTGDIPNHATLTNYGLTNVDIYATILELKGYFVGMFFLFFVFYLLFLVQRVFRRTRSLIRSH